MTQQDDKRMIVYLKQKNRELQSQRDLARNESDRLKQIENNLGKHRLHHVFEVEQLKAELEESEQGALRLSMFARLLMRRAKPMEIYQDAKKVESIFGIDIIKTAMAAYEAGE